MTPADGEGADPEGSGRAQNIPDPELQTQLVESLMYLLIEKGVLTRNDALSVVQTVAEIQHGVVVEDLKPRLQTQAAIDVLLRMYKSFEALEPSVTAPLVGGDNVRRLRPPVHGDRPEFPRDS